LALLSSVVALRLYDASPGADPRHMKIRTALMVVVIFLAPLRMVSQQTAAASTQTVYRVTPGDALSRLIVSDAISAWHPASQPAMAAFEVFVDASGKVTEARAFPTASDADLSAAQAIVKQLGFHAVSYRGSAVPFVSALALCSDSEVGTVPCAPALNQHGGVTDRIPQRLRLPGCDDQAGWKSCKIAAMKEHKISGKNPLYPDEAKHARIMGNVVVRLVISRGGEVTSTQVISGPPMLYESSVSALKTWKYRPFLWNGMAVEVECNAVIRYELRG
jgi:TonB family protein